ncbi:MAG: type II toxin-antitoxin system VapB family antitoxin [Pseudomonadota bacterium]
MKKAKLFKNGQSQAVRIPKEYRFNAKEVAVTPLGKGIVLQPIFKTWQNVFDAITPTDDFMQVRENDTPQNRDWEAFQ